MELLTCKKWNNIDLESSVICHYAVNMIEDWKQTQALHTLDVTHIDGVDICVRKKTLVVFINAALMHLSTHLLDIQVLICAPEITTMSL